jgi:hypothetical protein
MYIEHGPGRNELEIIAELEEKMDKVVGTNPEIEDQINEFAQGLVAEGHTKEELSHYKLFRVLTGANNPNEKEVPEFDLPGGEIERYIRDLRP